SKAKRSHLFGAAYFIRSRVTHIPTFLGFFVVVKRLFPLPSWYEFGHYCMQDHSFTHGTEGDMSQITYINADSTEQLIEADDQQSVMRAAILNGRSEERRVWKE